MKVFLEDGQSGEGLIFGDIELAGDEAEGAYRALCARCARAVRALCEKLAVLHHRGFGKFRRLKGRH